MRATHTACYEVTNRIRCKHFTGGGEIHLHSYQHDWIILARVSPGNIVQPGCRHGYSLLWKDGENGFSVL